jgi:hypothetical protein
VATKKVPLCTPVSLPKNHHIKAAKAAVAINPCNAPSQAGIAALISATALIAAGSETPTRSLEEIKSEIMTPGRLSLLTTKYWGTGGVKLTVGFMERIDDSLANKLLSHMNAWNTVAGANVQFIRTKTDPQVRISRGGGGYYSYLGSDVLQIPRNQQTMNLEGFTNNTPESEFVRVVRHETGHTLGFPHEHLRQELVNKLDVQKTIAYFERTQGWSEQEVREQVLTAISESELMDPTRADSTSIMCYQLPGSITKDGQPIIGGSDIDELDKEYARKVYPLSPPPPPPPGATKKLLIEFTGDYKIVQQP